MSLTLSISQPRYLTTLGELHTEKKIKREKKEF